MSIFSDFDLKSFRLAYATFEPSSAVRKHLGFCGSMVVTYGRMLESDAVSEVHKEIIRRSIRANVGAERGMKEPERKFTRAFGEKF